MENLKQDKNNGAITYLVSFDEIPWKKSLYILPLWDVEMTTCFHFVEKQIQIRQSWELVTQLCIEALVQMCDWRARLFALIQ